MARVNSGSGPAPTRRELEKARTDVKRTKLEAERLQTDLKIEALDLGERISTFNETSAQALNSAGMPGISLSEAERREAVAAMSQALALETEIAANKTAQARVTAFHAAVGKALEADPNDRLNSEAALKASTELGFQLGVLDKMGDDAKTAAFAAVARPPISRAKELLWNNALGHLTRFRDEVATNREPVSKVANLSGLGFREHEKLTVSEVLRESARILAEDPRFSTQTLYEQCAARFVERPPQQRIAAAREALLQDLTTLATELENNPANPTESLRRKYQASMRGEEQQILWQIFPRHEVLELFFQLGGACERVKQFEDRLPPPARAAAR